MINHTNKVPLQFIQQQYAKIARKARPVSYFGTESFTGRLKYFQVTAIVFMLISSLLNYLTGLYESLYVTAGSVLALALITPLFTEARIKTAYRTMLFIINATLVLICYLEGLSSGSFIYFFAVFFSFVFLAEAEESKEVTFTYIVCITAFVLAALISPFHKYLGNGPEDLSKENFFVNTIFSFFLILFMSHYIVKENRKRKSVIKNKQIFLNTVFNSSLHTDIIVSLDTGLICDFNNSAPALLALQPHQTLLDYPACNLFKELKEEGGEELLQEICKPSTSWKGEMTCIRMDGSFFPASVNIVSFMYHDNEYKKLTIVDDTEKHKMLQDLRNSKLKAEELAMAKAQFLSHMSHELRTPLNGIIGSANLLLHEKYLAEQKEQFDILKFSSEHMLSLINDILDISKLDAEKIELEKVPVDIGQFVKNIASTFYKLCQDKKLIFEVSVDERLNKELVADPTRLNQVLTNLISNAVKFTSMGSVQLKVVARSIKSDFVEVEFNVTDTGIGIRQDNKDKIFEQFTQADAKTTRKYGGTGLGLTISKRIVELMGGVLQVESEYSVGSRFFFTLRLPVHMSARKAFVTEAQADSEEPVLAGLRVLIAEDNNINMSIATKFFTKWGVEFQKARNGVEAVEIFHQQPFDVILLDLDMPEMDGYEALKIIRKTDLAIPALAFTAAVFEDMEQQLRAAGFTDYVTKPFRPRDLQSKLLSVVSSNARRA